MYCMSVWATEGWSCPAIPPLLAAVHPGYRGCGNPSAEEGDSRVHVERIQKALQDLGSDCREWCVPAST